MIKKYLEHDKVVTTIIPVVEKPEFLKEAIDSVFESTYTNNEIVVIDDLYDKIQSGKVRNLLKTYFDYPVRYIKNDQPIGIVKSISKGINLANGEYLTILKSSDKFERTWIEKGKTLLDKNIGDVIYAFIYNFGVVKGCAFLFHFEEKVLKEKNFIPYFAMFRKKDYVEIGGLNEDLKDADWDLWLRYNRDKKKFYFLGEPLLYHRVVRNG